VRTYKTVLVAVIAIAALSVQDASAQDPAIPTIAVMDFNGFMLGDGGSSVNLGKAVSAMLVTEFSGREGIVVVERQALNDLLQEQRLALSGRVDESSAVEIGKLLGAQYMFYGQVASIANNLRIDIRAVDVETSEIISVLKKMDQTSELLSVLVSIADEFSSELELVAPSNRPGVARIPVPAIIAFSRAVDYEDKGETAQAVEQYNAALELYPGYIDAERALVRLGGGE
jgi:TolB-like protein